MAAPIKNKNSKHRNRDEVQELKETIREQKSIIRNLQKRLKELSRKEHIYDEKINEDPIEEKEETDEIKCPKCKEGNLGFCDLGINKYHICNQCDYREKINVSNS